MMKEQKKHLYPLSELTDYEIESGYPDVRGWDVRDADNRVIGQVANLLADINSLKVVYLDVEVDASIISANHDPYGRPENLDIREFINEKGENHIIIPIGLVEMRSDPEHVFTHSVDHRTFAETKRMRKDSVIERGYEVIVLDSYGRKIKSDMDEDKGVNPEDEQPEERSLPRERTRWRKVREDDSFYGGWEFDDRRFRNRD